MGLGNGNEHCFFLVFFWGYIGVTTRIHSLLKASKKISCDMAIHPAPPFHL